MIVCIILFDKLWVKFIIYIILDVLIVSNVCKNICGQIPGQELVINKSCWNSDKLLIRISVSRHTYIKSSSPIMLSTHYYNSIADVLRWSYFAMHNTNANTIVWLICRYSRIYRFFNNYSNSDGQPPFRTFRSRNLKSIGVTLP